MSTNFTGYKKAARNMYLVGMLVFFYQLSKGQSNAAPPGPMADSATVRIRSAYDNVSGFHRWLFGENYRKDYAMAVKVPVLHLSQLHGGLMPVKEGGGMESRSLRLVDGTGKEWVLRSITKIADKLLPENLRGTFVVDWIGDEFSSQHPYSALCVAPLADAANVPHANPVIGIVADDPNLGQFRKIFAGLICMLEEREPAGESDNTIKFERELIKSYDTRFDGPEFLRARLLDLLMADWDRHEDQWRWAFTKEGKEKRYTAVPRDRDQVFHITTGVLPWIASWPWIDPILENFDGDIRRVRYSLFKTRFIKQYPDAQMSYGEWMKITDDFVKAETDEVLESALKRLPPEIYALRHQELLAKLKKRRNNIPAAMSEYYRFIYRIADLRTTDKDERIVISDAPGNATRLRVEKLNGNAGPGPAIMDMTYDPAITKEIRLYTSAGNDRIEINAANSTIPLRIVDSAGVKNYQVKQSLKKVNVYGRPGASVYNDPSNRLRLHLSADTATGRFVSTNPYNVWMPLATAAINKDEGFMLGLGFRYTGNGGFRKLPYTTIQQVMVTHSFATSAFSISYSGQWREAIGKADLTVDLLAQAPDNTKNFFGQGNSTVLNKFPGYRTFYRSRYDVYQLDPALRWQLGKGNSISAGPSVQLYRLDFTDNVGRALSQPGLIRSYDSTNVSQNKVHLGAMVNFTANHLDKGILPTGGFLLTIQVKGYGGLKEQAKSFMQVIPSFTWYQKLGTEARLVISDRIGGGISIGQPAFYQSMYLGGQGNLLGYLSNRFSGKHMLYNNLQARLRLADIAGYVLPGQLGITGFFDTGRVWQPGEHSTLWHHGEGGGIYFSPATLTVIQVLAGHSGEGWYPYIGLNFRI